jgi:uncharacterized protein YndB with AHSA1/START domain
MTHEFEVREEIELPAPPEQVWAAIATGPGVNSWFVGHTEIEPREGGQHSMTMADATLQSTVTGWEPGRRLAFQGIPGPDGAFMAFEYLIEGRDAGASGSGTTVLRFVHSGFLGDDWESEYDAVSKGDRMYLSKLASYLRYFPAKTAAFHVMCWGPRIADAERVWSAFTQAAELDASAGGAAVREGDSGLIAVGRAAPAQAIVDYAAPSFLGLRTSDSIYRFIHGYQDVVVVEQNAFAGNDQARRLAEDGWQDWLAKAFG